MAAVAARGTGSRRKDQVGGQQEKRETRSVWAVYSVLLVTTVGGLGLAWFTGYSAATLFCLAFFSSGGLLGFLFGIPRSYSRTADEADERNGGTPLLETNSNLVQVSDWLTKIIIGVTLVQLYRVPGLLRRFSAFAQASFGDSATGEAVAVASLLFFSVNGFLTGYLATRLILQSAFNEADGKLIKQKVAQALDARERKDHECVAVVQTYLFAPERPDKKQELELDEAVRQASGVAKEQFYQLCRTERRNTTNRHRAPELTPDERSHLLHRAIDIFEALQEADAKFSGDYRVYAELGYAYEGLGRLAEPPERECDEKAEQALSKAIELRKQTGRKQQYYEFYRAVVRIRLGREASLIKNDLRVALKVKQLREEAEDNDDKYDNGIKGWLRANRTTIPELLASTPDR